MRVSNPNHINFNYDFNLNKKFIKIDNLVYINNKNLNEVADLKSFGNVSRTVKIGFHYYSEIKFIDFDKQKQFILKYIK